MKQFPTKRPAGVHTLSFRFRKGLSDGETLVAGTMVVTAEVWRGTDPDPAAILLGSPAVSGDRVLQQVLGGLSRVKYLLRARCDTSLGNTLTLEGILPVEDPR